MQTAIEILGWVGMLCIIAAYLLVSSGKLQGRSVHFQLINLSGSILLVINALYHGALPLAGLNAAWIVIALVTLVQLTGEKRRDQDLR